MQWSFPQETHKDRKVTLGWLEREASKVKDEKVVISGIFCHLQGAELHHSREREKVFSQGASLAEELNAQAWADTEHLFEFSPPCD